MEFDGMIKTCSCCEELLPIEDFYVTRGRRMAHCKTCQIQKVSKTYDREQAREYARARRAKLREQATRSEA